jgi:hypothetical protein
MIRVLKRYVAAVLRDVANEIDPPTCGDGYVMIPVASDEYVAWVAARAMSN